MKKVLLFFILISFGSIAQTNIAIPSFSATTGSFNAASGQVKFYLNGTMQAFNVGVGANAVCFAGNNMFVAYDGPAAVTAGVLWYQNATFNLASGNTAFSAGAPTVLPTGNATFSVAADAAGNVYAANSNGTITKFTKQAIAPFYSSAASTSMSFWNTAQFADASGVTIDDATGTLWAVSYENNQAAVCRLSNFGTAGTIKYLNGPANFFQKPEGVAKDGSGNIWIANNNNNEVLRLNNSVVTTIVAELNANNYANKALVSPADIQNFSISPPGHQLGGLVYDNLYSSKMYVNDQISGGNTNIYSFTADNSSPTFSTTSMSQVYPGAGQGAIIPCALLANNYNPIATSMYIINGQTASFTASGCPADQTYRWKLAGNTVANTANFTTGALSATTSFTAHCVRAATCESPGINVSAIIPTPLNSYVAVPRLSQDSVYFYYGNTAVPSNKYKALGQTPNGITFYGSDMFLSSNSNSGSGTINWYSNVSFSPYNFTPATTPIYLSQIYGSNAVTGTTQTVTDLSGNIYAASKNGIVTKFFRDVTTPYYSNLRQVGIRIGSTTDVIGAISIDETAGTLWVTNETQNYLAVLKLSDIPALPNPLTVSIVVPIVKSPFVKLIAPNVSTLNPLFANSKGIASTPGYGVWFTSNDNTGTLSRIKESKVSSIMSNLASSNYNTEYLLASEIDVYTSFVGSGGLGSRLGGLKFDGIYSQKLLISNQVNTGAGIKKVLVIDPASASPLSTLVETQYDQGFPGVGHIGIIPCALAPLSNPVASNVTISAGQTATLTATGCLPGQAYRWKQAFFIRSLTASYTTPVLNASTNYQAFCVVGNCLSPGLTVNVTVNPPVLAATANPSSVCPNFTSTLTATGCLGNITWNNGGTNTSTLVSPGLTTTYTATCSTSGSTTVTVTVLPNPTVTVTSSVPTIISDCGGTEVVYLGTGLQTTLTAVGCSGTLSWSDNIGSPQSSASTFTVQAPLPGAFGTYANVTCTSANGCTAVASIAILNEFATDDAFTTTVGVAVTGNVKTNDTMTGLPFPYVSTPPAHGTLNWVMSFGRPTGVVTYTPAPGYVGTDSFTYFETDDLICSKKATVTITISGPGTPCPQIVTITGNTPNPHPANTIIAASNFINTSSLPTTTITSANSNNLTYQAGKAINLNPGFSVNVGAVFTAKISGCGNAQVNQTMKVTGRHLYDIYGNQFIMRGVNYPVHDDWDFPSTDLITEIEKSKSNVVRLEWYKTPAAGRPAYTNADLNNLLTKCETNKMIPILELQDLTCAEDANRINTELISFWTDPAIVTILNNHKKYVIINIANEVGKYRWNGYTQASLDNWKNAYKTAITSIRNAGLNMPIMIDSPDCGSDVKAILDAGQEIINHDPQHNIMFSVHAYWAGYNGNADLTAAIAANLTVVFGEIANKQDESIVLRDGNGNPILDGNGDLQYVTSYCHYNIDGTTVAPNNPTNGFQYQTLLNTLQTNNIGWLSWAWVRDGCSPRNMTNNNPNAPYGGFNTLTTFGNDIVNNPTYGIFNTSVRTIFTP